MMTKHIYHQMTAPWKQRIESVRTLVDVFGESFVDNELLALEFLHNKSVPLAECAKKSADEARRLVAMAQETQKLYDEDMPAWMQLLDEDTPAEWIQLAEKDTPAWMQLSDELEAEFKKYNVDVKGMCYYALCPECGETVERETSEDLSGRVMGFECDECGTAFFDHVDGKAKYLQTQIAERQKAILQVLTGDELPMTIRHVFYALAGYGYVKKNDAGYDAVVSTLGDMRERGQVPYSWLADNTRWHIKPRTFNSLADMLDNTVRTYRRALWDTQNVYVELWCEKDAVASILSSVTEPYDVPLFVARGFASTTWIYNVAEHIKKTGKPAYIYHFGDFDPSGVMAFNAARKKLKDFGAKVEVVRVAVTEEQIQEWNLPTRETKKADKNGKLNMHALSWGDKPSVELDVLPPSRLRELARACIERHINHYELDQIKRVEEAEKTALYGAFQNFQLARKVEMPGGDA